MSVKSSDLDNRESGMALSDRTERKKQKELESNKELKLIKERMETAAGLERPPDRAPHCGDCYKRGWHAAVKAIRDGVFP